MSPRACVHEEIDWHNCCDDLFSCSYFGQFPCVDKPLKGLRAAKQQSESQGAFLLTSIAKELTTEELVAALTS